MKTLVIIVFVTLSLVTAYKPVIYFHGLFGTPNSFELTQRILQQRDPNTKVFAIDMYGRVDSLKALTIQVVDLTREINKLKKQHNFSKFHLVCSSQGGLVCRNFMMNEDMHDVATFMTLASPNMGQFGIPDIAFLRQLIGNLTRDAAHHVLYTPLMQARISFANLWNDPKQQKEYLSKNVFLPFVSNQIAHEQAAKYKRNFLKIGSFISYGSAADEVLDPWQSTIFGYWDETGKVIVPMKQQSIYTQDTFGLATLERENRFFAFEEQGFGHWDWLKNETMIRKFITYFD